MIKAINKNYHKYKTLENISKNILIYGGLTVLTLMILIPFYIIIITSLKNRFEAMSIPFTFIPKEGIVFANYLEVLTYKSGGDTMPTVVRGFVNTLWMVIPPTIIGTLLASISAYSFAKLKFRFKDKLFSILILTMMIPGTIMLTPSYVLYDMIGWVDTPLPIMLPDMFGGVFCVFFMRQFFMGIPDDLVEASKLDGMSYLGIFFKVMMPLAIPAFLAQVILAFVNGYNEYLGPLIYLHSPNMYTLQIALSFFQGTYSTNWAVVMAGAILAIIPTIILYLFAQKYFIKGIVTTGMKL